MEDFTNKKNTHILVIPYPAQGHIIPMMDLTNQLAIRGLAITIFTTPKNLHILKPLVSNHPNLIQTLVLPFPSDPAIPAGVENMQELPLTFFPRTLTALAKLHDPLLSWFQSHPDPPRAIISDIFLSLWTYPLARHLGIRLLGFSPVQAASMNELWGRMESRKEGDMNESFVKALLASKASDGLILNTFDELERGSLAYLKSTYLGQQPVWAVGPLLPIKDGNDRGGPSSVPTSEVMTWLDSCQVDKSVVYVCFGSQINLTGSQMEVLADALDNSGVRFIWVVKDLMRGIQVAGDSEDLIPLGFEDRVAGRGLVIRGWAPQVEILQHRAVGSYLTHCGWTSALEGLLTETLLLLWPMQANQFENATLLVDRLGVSVRVCEGLETVPNAIELARILAESVDSTRPERARAMELRRVALDSTKPCGSSYMALDELVKDLCKQ